MNRAQRILVKALTERLRLLPENGAVSDLHLLNTQFTYRSAFAAHLPLSCRNQMAFSLTQNSFASSFSRDWPVIRNLLILDLSLGLHQEWKIAALTSVQAKCLQLSKLQFSLRLQSYIRIICRFIASSKSYLSTKTFEQRTIWSVSGINAPYMNLSHVSKRT